ncbi:hypothetical protein [Cryptosporangium arvum]|uniref:Uncharacterized protein n=1 Tax=Cryptosporangium arvum DSM 44712 TaxID=927661 RepID=A0A011A029_9ACTN|nr:hypothetical protein [Cryptosporangium arvum]EXG82827.1 hypothetical protein CryarDRAFT_4028 [Cryptosporangium arvum DSM 44712]
MVGRRGARLVVAAGFGVLLAFGVAPGGASAAATMPPPDCGVPMPPGADPTKWCDDQHGNPNKWP